MEEKVEIWEEGLVVEWETNQDRVCEKSLCSGKGKREKELATPWQTCLRW